MGSTDDKTMNSSNTQPLTPGNGVRKADKSDPGRVANKSNGERNVGKQGFAHPLHRYQTERASKGSKALYVMVIGACVLLVGSLALYISTATRKPWSPVPESGGSFEPRSVSVAQPKLEQLPPATAAPLPKEIVPEPVRTYAVIDVPDVGLRNVPDVAMKATSSGLKRGERVEVWKRISGKGPGWIKIKTKSGKVGWVIASLAKERKGR